MSVVRFPDLFHEFWGYLDLPVQVLVDAGD